MSGRWRVQRVKRELQQVIASYLLSGFHKPLHGLVTVSRVEVNSDLRGARIFISFMGSEEEASENMGVLTENIGEIQREVSRKLRMKFCPKLQIIWDRGFAHYDQINETLKGLNMDREDSVVDREGKK